MYTIFLTSLHLQTVYIDIVVPFPSVYDSDPYLSPYKYLLTCRNHSTCLSEVQLLTEITAQSVTKAFVYA